jgi:hypothetical protein
VKKNALEDTQAIAELLEIGKATRRDLLAFLIYIREDIPNDMIRDLAHFVAHANRDRGYAFSYTEKFVTHLVDTFRNGGRLRVEPIFGMDTLIVQLCKDVHALGIQIDLAKMSSHRAELEQLLTELLEGVSLELKSADVQSCVFEKLKDRDMEFLTFVIELVDLSTGVITVPKNLKLAFSVFG